MSYKRRKGAAIIDTPRGIVVVAGKSKKFMLPGGKANRKESRKNAAIRELHEETGLKTRKIKFLFSYIGSKWRSRKGRLLRNHTKVFLIKASGMPIPRHEIKYIEFWRPDSKINITAGTKKVIENYTSISGRWR